MGQKGLIFVISAPSGSGKTTLCKELLSSSPGLVRSVSMTTRPARKGETEGKDYFFVSKEEFERRKEKGEFLEWAEVFANSYGTPAKFVKDTIKKGNDVLLAIDVKGAMHVKEKYPEAVFIFILPPSMEVLESRLMGRSTDNKTEMKKRLGVAKLELSYLNRYNYVIVNDRLELAVEKLRSIVTAERCKLKPGQPPNF